MYPSLLPFLIQALLFSPTISALCSACSSYNAALSACSSNSVNVTAIGSPLNTAAIHCMCSDKNSGSQMNQCSGCSLTDTSDDDDTDEPNDSVLQAWVTTCVADTQYGDQQAVLCWEGQPTNPLPCYLKGGAGDNLPTNPTNSSK